MLERELIMDNDGNLVFLFVARGFVTWNEKQQEFSEDHNFIHLPETLKVIDIAEQPGTKKILAGNANRHGNF